MPAISKIAAPTINCFLLRVALIRLLPRRYKQKLLQVIFRAAMDKSLGSMLKAICQTKANAILIRAAHPRASSTKNLLGIALEGAKTCTRLSIYKDGMSVEDGLELAIEAETVVVVCGSLYLYVAAQTRRWLAYKHPHIFSKRDWVHEPDSAGETTT